MFLLDVELCCFPAADDLGMTQIMCLRYPIKSQGSRRRKAAMCKAQKQLSKCQIELIPAFTKRYTVLKLSHRHPVLLIQEYFPAALIQITSTADIVSVEILFCNSYTDQMNSLLSENSGVLFSYSS